MLLPFFITYQNSFRLLAVDAPEVVGADKAEGLRWKEALEALIPPGTLVTVHTTKADKYGRWLASIEKDELSVNHVLVESMTMTETETASP